MKRLLCRPFVLLVKNAPYNHKKFIKDVKQSVYILEALNWIEFDVVGLQNIDNTEYT